MNRILLRAVAGAIIFGTVGMAPATTMSPKMLREAASAAQKATASLKDHRQDQAVKYAERAVLFAPQSADNRALLGQAYLRSGRFVSAGTAFGDALRLDPAHGRAALGLALANIALGKTSEAMIALQQARGHVPDADFGLALALTGDHQAALGVLEPAARAEGADAKVRQNLALTYVLAGRWAEARTTAAQDLSPDLVDRRMTEWAQFARPVGSADQVASLIGTRPVHDAGMPSQLALIEGTSPSAALAAAPPAQPPVEMAAAEPAATIAAAPATDVVPVPVPESIAAAEPIVPVSTAQARATMPMASTPKPALAALARPIKQQPYLVTTTAAATPVRAKPMFVKPALRRAAGARSGNANYVIQLGAFSSHGRLESAWSGAIKHASWLGGYQPLSTTFSANNRTFHRLAVSGFATRLDAVNICRKVRAHGAACFVRNPAGDRPVQWAARKSGTPYAMG